MRTEPLSPYALYARLLPGTLALAPLSLGVACWIGVAPAWQTFLGSGIVALALGALTSQAIRDEGVRGQSAMWARWGGPPSVAYLRHRDPTIPMATKLRYHNRLKELLPDLRIPSEADERANPTLADHVYTSCSDYLRARTRDTDRFALLHDENKNYGFRRNLLAARPLMIGTSLLGLVSSTVRLYWTTTRTGRAEPIAILTGLVCALLLASCIVRIREAWVRLAANAYARALLEACDSLTP